MATFQNASQEIEALANSKSTANRPINGGVLDLNERSYNAPPKKYLLFFISVKSQFGISPVEPRS